MMDSSTASNCSGPENAFVSNLSPAFTPPIKSEQLPVGKKLTKDLVLSKSKGGSLIEIKKIVVWGQKIADCSIVTEIPELEVASMNANKISSLEHFGQCPNLRELFLRSNCIEDLNEIYHLKDLPNLQVLWLAGNPCTKHPKYRSTIIRNLEQLQKLDDTEISSAERTSSDSEGLLFEEPPARPTVADPAGAATAASTDPLPIDLDERMRPAEDAKLQDSSVKVAVATSPPKLSAVQALDPDSAAATAAESGDSDQSLSPGTSATSTSSAALSETSATVSESLWTSSAALAASASTQSTGRPGGVASGPPLPRYALAEVRTAVLRLIRLLDQESLQLVMHTVRARLQEGAAQPAQPPQQQTGDSEIAPSFSLDNL